MATTAPNRREITTDGVSNGCLQSALRRQQPVKLPQDLSGAGAALVSARFLMPEVPSFVPDGGLQPGQCSSPQGRETSKAATGSSIAAAYIKKKKTAILLRENSSSTHIRSNSDNQMVKCSPCAPDPGAPPVELETCPICLDELSGQPLGVCLGSSGSRSCDHYFHFDCLRKVEGASCPQCRTRFRKRALLPNIIDDEESWFMHVSSSGKDALNKREVSSALKAMLYLAPEDIDDLVASSWDTWTLEEDLLSRSSIHDLAATIAGHMPATSSCGFVSPHTVQENESEHLEDGHTRSGVVCSCGQVHVRRGDRVRRGPMPSDVDHEWQVAPGQLGTIVHVGEGQETVTIKWDRCPEDLAYIWPDPEGLVLAPAQFGDVAQDVMDLQEETGLSSMAAEEVLHRGGSELLKRMRCEIVADRKKNREGSDCLTGTLGSLRLGDCITEDWAELYRVAGLSEQLLRKPPKLYHRVRILPDKFLVQQWFDSVRPCSCTRTRCSGGVQWSSQADKHLGREGVVLKVDDNDGTVLVETRGPCQCQIWYPRLALEHVFDPDLAAAPQFKIMEQVECKMASGWERGVVNEVLWRGIVRDGPAPYSVKLDSGSDIFVPHVNLIRKAPIAQAKKSWNTVLKNKLGI